MIIWHQGFSDTYAADVMGYGLINAIELYPNTFDSEEVSDVKGV